MLHRCNCVMDASRQCSAMPSTSRPALTVSALDVALQLVVSTCKAGMHRAVGVESEGANNSPSFPERTACD